MATLQSSLDAAVLASRALGGGAPAAYIPELRGVDPQTVGLAVTLADGTTCVAGDGPRFTLQSAAKLIVLCGLLEERGLDAVLDVVDVEPSGTGFASIAALETKGPRPANPLVNAGAIALCGQLGGNLEDRLGWLEDWCVRLFGERLPVNARVLASERRTGDRNRAIAYLLQSAGVLTDATATLEIYFSLCSLEADVGIASRLPALLAARGRRNGVTVLTPDTAARVVAIMATCGMYNESGRFLVQTGMPAKSGVSGVIVAVANGRAGVAVHSPPVNPRGSSVRGLYLLERLSHEHGWHFAG
ncbi:MAG: glutaminase [Myxococcota bacterium]|jgi:glutaminase